MSSGIAGDCALIIESRAPSSEAEAEASCRNKSKTNAVEARTRRSLALFYSSLIAFTRSIHQCSTFGIAPSHHSVAARECRFATLPDSVACRCAHAVLASFAPPLALALTGQLLGGAEARRRSCHLLAESAAAPRL